MPQLLAVMPHPDDEAYSSGGLIALAARAGWDAEVVCASFGERGRRHDGGPAGREALATTRLAELSAACRALGAGPPRILGLPDGGLGGVTDGPSRVAGLLAERRPGLLLTLGADGVYGHPDHLAVHRWVREAWEGAGRPCPLLLAAFPRGLFLPQWEKVRGMLGEPPSPPADAIGAPEPHYAVPIATVAAAKLAAVGAHRSQLPGGDPEALFPPGIVAALMATEWYHDAAGPGASEALALLRSVAPGAVPLSS
jgi:LmbE family N-acetylglucosaminyl deacetylase